MDTSQKPRRWRAKWIWAAGDGKEPNVFYYFRRELAWDGPTDSARLFIAADTRYQLFVNGQFVGRGAPQSQPYYQYYDERDLGPFLKPGANCIAVLVNYVGNQPDTRGGLLAELVDGRGQTRLITDGSWRVARAAAYAQNTFHFRMNKTAAYQEVFDSRR
ncbi:MAG: alpha-L-rhamnosidase, partial [Planctomycetes bacterium]|nr:alpha-L-rhamnosidase [Planctomycetota bacterium]